MDEEAIAGLLAAARQAQRAGQGEDAARLYGEVLARGREHPAALNALGMRALAARDAGGATALFGRAIAADPRAPELHMNLASAHRLAQDTAAERAALEGALAIDQRHFMALVRLAELFERTGEPARAAERWSGVLALAAQVTERTPALEQLVARADDYVARHQAEFGRAIDGGLFVARATVPVGKRRRFDACVDHLLGRRKIYVNEPSGLHFPFLPPDEYFDRALFPFLPAIEAQAGAIRAELEGLLAAEAQRFTPYVEMPAGTPANIWSPLDHRLDWSAFHLWRNGVRDDAACARCPVTTAAVEALPLARIPNRAPSVFFSLLRPGTHLPAHSGVSNVRAIVHVPLIVPAGCSFRVGGETREWREGEAWAFDDTIEHEAWNRSDQLRAILIFDVWNPHLTDTEQRLLADFFPVADRSGYDLRTQVGE